ncbi:MAG: hypothetical protein ACRCT7_07505 [Shewanella sp.]
MISIELVTDNPNPPARLNVGISTATLARLLSQGHVCVAELSALDVQTKQQLWQMCLQTCKHAIDCDALKQTAQ